MRAKFAYTDPCDADAAIMGSRFAFYRSSVNTGVGRCHSSDLRQRRTARATTFVSSGVRRRHFSGGALVILFTVFVQHTDHSFPVTHSTMTRKTTVSKRLRKAAWINTAINKHTTCEVHHLAFHTRLFPRFPVLQFGSAFSSVAFLASPSWAIIISEIISQCATWDLQCDNWVMLLIDKLFVSKFVFYVVFFELMVKKFTQYLFQRLLVHIVWRYYKTIRKVCAIAKIGSRVKCWFRRAGCEEVPMWKVPGKFVDEL